MFVLANSSYDIEIKNIINNEGEWHQKIYDLYKNNSNTNKIKLNNIKKKTQDKKWIYRWTGIWKYVPIENKYYERYLFSSNKYLCNM